MTRLPIGTLVSLALGAVLFVGCNSNEAPPASPPSGAIPGTGAEESHPPEARDHGDGQASAGEHSENVPATIAKTDTHKNVAEKRHEHHDHGAHRGHETRPQGSVKIGGVVPDFSVRTLDGKSVKLSELQNDERLTNAGVVVLSFWCTTCHSCRDVEHLLARLSRDYRGRAAVIALAANADETAESVDAFLKENGLELPVVLDPSGSTADLFGVNRTTTTVVIDGNGVLRYCGQLRHDGGGSAEEALKSVLAGKEVAIKTTPHHG
ncbi:MAG: TlpA family protein disulfide reductase [Planctomycetes bacterium]|nr:TlpA family protein disulfide reductase [Planctomycetota bacterium]